jgi:hypothetical protein
MDRIENDAANNSSVVACIHCHRNVFTEPLPSNDRGDNKYGHRMMGGIYEVRRWDGLTCHDINTKFHKIGSGIQKLTGGNTQTHTDSKVIS